MRNDPENDSKPDHTPEAIAPSEPYTHTQSLTQHTDNSGPFVDPLPIPPTPTLDTFCV